MKPIQIYIGNDETRDVAEMIKPHPDNYFKDESYWNALEAYQKHTDTLPRHKVTGPHSWKVGQRLEEGVDFRTEEQIRYIDGDWGKRPTGISYPVKDTRTVIIPIEGEQEDEDLRQIENDLVEALQYDNTVGTVIEYLRQNWQLTRKK